MVRLDIGGLLWLSERWGLSTKCVVHRVGADFARRSETRQPPSLIKMDDVMRARITSSASTQTTLCPTCGPRARRVR